MRSRLGSASAVIVALAALLTGCSDDGGGNEATIELRDYAFEIEGSLDAGVSTIEMRNTGAEIHMVAFGRLQEGKGLADVRSALEAEDESAFGEVFAEEIDAPGGFLSPGKSFRVTTPFLTEGRYALICFIPTEGEGAPHFVKGMINEMEVGDGDADATPDVDRRITINNGNIDGPVSLEAGETTFAITSSGVGPHEILMVRKRQDNVTFEQLDQAFNGAFENPAGPPRGFAQQLQGEIVASTFDIASGSTIYVTVDLEPGSYFIGCARQPGDEEGPPGPPHRELLEVRVT